MGELCPFGYYGSCWLASRDVDAPDSSDVASIPGLVLCKRGGR